MKRLLGLVILLCLLPAGTAAATGGRSDMRIVDNRLFTAVHGPGFNVLLTQFGLHTSIDDSRFGVPSAGYPIVRNAVPLPSTVTPFQCENGTYSVVSGTFTTVTRGSAPGPRPAPYPATFGTSYPNIFTFVGTLDAVATNEAGEPFRILMSDLAHETIDERFFKSTNPIHAYIVDERGRVRDRASLVGRVKVDLRTGEAKHDIVDEGTCHQTATRFGTPGVTVFGPFFVLPFPTTVITR